MTLLYRTHHFICFTGSEKHCGFRSELICFCDICKVFHIKSIDTFRIIRIFLDSLIIFSFLIERLTYLKLYFEIVNFDVWPMVLLKSLVVMNKIFEWFFIGSIDNVWVLIWRYSYFFIKFGKYRLPIFLPCILNLLFSFRNFPFDIMFSSVLHLSQFSELCDILTMV